MTQADDIHHEKLGRTWKPDPWGAHDALTAHPHTAAPGSVRLGQWRETKFGLMQDRWWEPEVVEK